jgi:serine/threonine-protein kinase
MIGRILDHRYEIQRLLGAGGMGSVYAAQHVVTRRRVAVKVIARDLAENPEMAARFEREARAASLVDTAHIVQVLDAGRDPELRVSFLVMELLQGEDLQSAIRRLGPFPPELALRIAAQTCIGLQKAHEASIVHRDIKPGNLFLARQDDGQITVKLLDFGIAKIKQDKLSLTRTGHVLGSPAYVSPEQAKGSKAIDHRTDVWSLGTVLYEMLCGRTPHGGLNTLAQILLAVCAIPARPLRDIAPWVSAEAAAVVHGCLTIDANLRISSARGVFEAIRPLLRHDWSLPYSMFVPLDSELFPSVPPKGSATTATTILSRSNVIFPQPSAAPSSQHRRGRSDG